MKKNSACAFLFYRGYNRALNCDDENIMQSFSANMSYLIVYYPASHLLYQIAKRRPD
jgi:hypothetical protein